MSLNAGPTKTIKDLVPDVIDALQGRTDVSSAQVGKYVQRALQEITDSTVFEELRRSGSPFVLTIGQTIYPVSNFINSGDEYTYNESFSIFVDYPSNSVVATIKYRTPTAIEPMMAAVTKGIPAWWTRFGTNLHLGPTPNNPYTVFMRYQMRHPFSGDLLSTPLYIPDVWEEVVVYSAAERIAIVKRWNDQAKTLHDILYGDPEFMSSQGKMGRPGLISARLLQHERDQKFSTRQFTPRVARYTR